MTTLIINHSHEAGTLLEGTTRGDGSAPILKAYGWRWGRSINAWYIPMSRDRHPKTHKIDATAAGLRAKGFEVETDIDTTVRSTAEVEAGKLARQNQRVGALAAKADRKATEANVARNRADAAHARLPWGGEPIKIGHRSESQHRRDIERAHTTQGQAIKADADAGQAAIRAETAARTNTLRYSPQPVANRIEKLGAEIRRLERELKGHTRVSGPYRDVFPPAEGEYRERILSQLDEQKDALAYWQGIRADQLASGQAVEYGPEQIKKGDAVKIGGHWREVVRANRKTVSVATGYSWTARAPYTDVQGHRPAQD
ncbi:DUF3560 domain-containing protein [Sinomonas sp. JGH33]|uniref:DUF3560 domain-containing protein n=1 Tax=Sinomonas terricola TaxID=3110330 RepID=A0ABU5TAM9_9MICC|nr:DUF3560 domain-containing protein [Sinomonas sp. JGH33]MEA5456733.1 DUF3560 domain-containing protein [Sinomonas sp. JGH33]